MVVKEDSEGSSYYSEGEESEWEESEEEQEQPAEVIKQGDVNKMQLRSSKENFKP